MSEDREKVSIWDKIPFLKKIKNIKHIQYILIAIFVLLLGLIYFSTTNNSNKQEVTITYNTATGKLTATSSSSGGGGTVTPTCTPSAKITGLTLNKEDGTVTLTGSLTETCGKDTYYGWQYCTDGKSWSDNVYIAGAASNAHHSSSPVSGYSQT